MVRSAATWVLPISLACLVVASASGCHRSPQPVTRDDSEAKSGAQDSADERAPPETLKAEANKRLASLVVKFQKQPFAQFYRELRTTDTQDYVEAGRTTTDAAVTDLASRLSDFYAALPVTSTVQVPIPQSDAVVSFDCVPRAQQPALLKNFGAAPQMTTFEQPPKDPDAAARHVVEAPEVPSGATNTPTSDPKVFLSASAQPACPQGTVAIRRNSLPEAATRSGIKQWSLSEEAAAKISTPPTSMLDRNAMRSALKLGGINNAQAGISQHRYAHAAQSVVNYGVASRLSVWSPHVMNGDMSLSQVWVIGGNPNDSSLQTAEAGWQVYTTVWDPKFSALFVYQTSDNYGTTGCYVTLCTGATPARPEAFRITTNKIVIGKPIQPQSAVGGPQSVIEVRWIRNQETGSWWLKVDGDWIGYYPSSVYADGALTQSSNYIDFGGEATGVAATSEMGSGHYAQEGNGAAGFHSHVRYVTAAGQFADAALQPYETDDPCYTLSLNGPTPPEANAGTYFYFGGPGVHHFQTPAPAKEACSDPPPAH